MESIKATRTVFTASQFLDWQRSRTLELNPIFQRRPVWKPPARSQLIDSIVRGFPIPIILLRQVQDLNTLTSRMEVVDGQQRLRTLIAYLDPGALPHFSEATDEVIVLRNHNAEIAGRPFPKLQSDAKRAILDYEFSTHILPASTGDALVFKIFARLNSTGLSLNKQEIRNAEFHGAFKTLAYDLSFQFLDQWRRWGVFNNDNIARMEEAEAVSEFLIVMLENLGGKNQSRITKMYAKYDDSLESADSLSDRFTRIMTALDESVGTVLASTVFRRPALFFSLFVAVYDHCYGLGSSLKKRGFRPLPAAVPASLQRLSDRIKAERLPEDVQDAMERATSDPKRRKIRHTFLMKELKLNGAR